MLEKDPCSIKLIVCRMHKHHILKHPTIPRKYIVEGAVSCNLCVSGAGAEAGAGALSRYNLIKHIVAINR